MTACHTFNWRRGGMWGKKIVVSAGGRAGWVGGSLQRREEQRVSCGGRCQVAGGSQGICHLCPHREAFIAQEEEEEKEEDSQVAPSVNLRSVLVC